MNLEEKFIETKKGRIYYIESGAQGPQVVYLHGGMGKPFLSLRLVSNIKGIKVIAPYLPGHGLSMDIPSNFNYTNYLSVISGFINSVCSQNFILMGHSFGGRLVTDLVKNNNFTNKIILYAPLLQKVPSFYKTSINILIDWLTDCEYRTNHSRYYNVTIRDPKWINLSKVWRVIHSIPTHKQYNFVNKTLILWGKNDRVLPLKTNLPLLNNLPNKTIKIFSGGHYCYQKNQTRFFRTIEEFIKNK